MGDLSCSGFPVRAFEFTVHRCRATRWRSWPQPCVLVRRLHRQSTLPTTLHGIRARTNGSQSSCQGCNCHRRASYQRGAPLFWKAATRKHSKMVKQIAANWSGRSHLHAGLAAWANGDEDIIVYRSPLDYLLWMICAKDVDRLPSRRKMRKEDALLHPPPNLSDYDVNARGPGSAPAIWFRQWYGRDYDDSKHRSSYESARRLWRRMVPEEQRAAALLARPMPLQSLQPRITLANAQDYPPPNLQDFMKEELGPGSAPYRWYAQMMGEDWQPACSIAYDTARKRWRRLLPEVRERERDRERTRERIEGAKNPHSGTTALSGGCEPLPGRIWYPGR